MCFLQEMQWKHAAAFNTGEFFQGAFEMVDDDTAVLLWLGDDASRPMGERGKAFLDQYCKKAQVPSTSRDLTCRACPSRARPRLPDRRRRTGQPPGAALRGRPRPRPGAAPLHVQGRVLSWNRCHMLNFDADRFLRSSPGRWRQAEVPSMHVVGEFLDAGGANLVFAGAGGPGILMRPAADLLVQRVDVPGRTSCCRPSSSPAVRALSAEVPGRDPVAVRHHGRERGDARVLPRRWAPRSSCSPGTGEPTGPEADHSLRELRRGRHLVRVVLPPVPPVALSIMGRRGETDAIRRPPWRSCGCCPELLLGAKECVRAAGSGVRRGASPRTRCHIITGAGNVWPQAFYYGMCILEEMQWIRTRRCTRPTSSTARSSWSRPESASSCSRVRSATRAAGRAGRGVRRRS